MNRRTLLTLAASAPLLHALPSAEQAVRSCKAVAFDALALFDTRPIAASVEQTFPGKGDALNSAWRSRQFEYTWLRTLTGSYADFWSVTEDALVYATRALNLSLTQDQRRHLMNGYLNLRAWPDADGALKKLQDAGIRLVLLSNFTPAMLNSAVTNSSLHDRFEAHLSTDRVRAYKPDPRAYRMAIDSLNLRRDEIVFAAFAGWDAAGAKAFGFPTFWVNRSGAPAEELGSAPDRIGSNLNDLVRFVL